MTHLSRQFHFPLRLSTFRLCQHINSPKARLSTMAFSEDFRITKPNRSDFDEWAALFRGYINFYESSIPEDQYQKTFERIMDPKSDLYALVMRQQQAESGNGKIIAIAHFFPEQTPWSEKKIMLLNGRMTSSP